MNILLAPDSFKGSLSSMEAAKIMREAIKEICNDEVTIKPMADGGEGTIEAILSATEGKEIQLTCSGPLGNSIQSSYAIIDGNTAIIETALLAGLTQVPNEKRNPEYTTTYGIGEAILDGLERGCTSFIIGLGGSATNDGGLGMLQALGLRAWDEDGNTLTGFGSDLKNIHKISTEHLDPRLDEISIKVACDVDNPLCGPNGASYIYGPQKGGTAEQVEFLDKALDNFGSLLEKDRNLSLKTIPGAGAAGGLGFALLALGGELVSGAQLIAQATLLEETLKKSDLVITGEGQSDQQTLFGKAPGYIADLANKHDIPILLISGSLGDDSDKLREKFNGCFSIVNKPLSLEACMEHSSELLAKQTKQIITLIHSFY
ncbi:glycerate kinase [Saliterribacillus persicus]|uniref:Glycerate kinase n=1 Tax=Saliterribacillus persicus TaxID=930114 RepID=A0A368Y645_9BACI|nr:glycerate kinase [Saliterribacillus persicus]RCW74808.1 glycerate kinase [Saliterribacillus persicus]